MLIIYKGHLYIFFCLIHIWNECVTEKDKKKPSGIWCCQQVKTDVSCTPALLLYKLSNMWEKLGTNPHTVAAVWLTVHPCFYHMQSGTKCWCKCFFFCEFWLHAVHRWGSGSLRSTCPACIHSVECVCVCVCMLAYAGVCTQRYSICSNNLTSLIRWRHTGLHPQAEASLCSSGELSPAATEKWVGSLSGDDPPCLICQAASKLVWSPVTVLPETDGGPQTGCLSSWDTVTIVWVPVYKCRVLDSCHLLF